MNTGNSKTQENPVVFTRADMFTLWRSNENDLETTFDPECTAIVGRTPPELKHKDDITQLR